MAHFLRIKDANIKLAENQEWHTLYARTGQRDFGGELGNLPIISVALELTPEEMLNHAAGQPIIIEIVGNSWPPLALRVGDDG